MWVEVGGGVIKETRGQWDLLTVAGYRRVFSVRKVWNDDDQRGQSGKEHAQRHETRTVAVAAEIRQDDRQQDLAALVA